jgi:hypothetical protein
MKQLLLCSGIDGQSDSIARLRQWAAQRKPEAILFAGGVLSPERECAVRTTPWCLTVEDQRFALGFFRTISHLAGFSALIPAPNFEPLDEFCRLALAGEVDFPRVHLVHATLVEERDLAVCGLGVIIREEAYMREDCYTRIQANYFLRALRTSRKPRKVLLLPEPPPGVLGGPDGNPIVGEIIDSFRPNLCVVGGLTQRRGVQRIASTLVVNPGRLSDNSAAWLDWNKDRPVEFLGEPTTPLSDQESGILARPENLGSFNRLSR